MRPISPSSKPKCSSKSIKALKVDYRGLNLVKAPKDKEEGEGFEHYLASVTQFILNNKIGTLPYPVQTGEALDEHEPGIMKKLIDDID